jgi:hypothetical protein
MALPLRPRGSLSPERLYGRLLALYPVAFRADHGDEMRQLVRDRLRYDGPGVGPGIRFWSALYFDLLRTALLERLEQLMEPAILARYGGILGMAGGLLWVSGWTAVGSGAAETESVVLFFLLALAGITGSLLALAADPTLPGERMRVAGALLGGLGVFLLIAGIITGAWWLFAGSLFSGVLGTLLVGLSMLLSGWMPPVYAWSLIATALALIPSNADNWQVWLTVPFGVAWVAAGYALWSHATSRLTLAP